MPLESIVSVGIEAKSVPFTTKSNLVFAQRFDKHKADATHAMRRQDFISRVHNLLCCINLLPHIYNCVDNQVVLVSRRSIFAEEDKTLCVMSNVKEHLHIAMAQEAVAALSSYTVQCDNAVDSSLFNIIHELEIHLGVACTNSSTSTSTLNENLKPYMHKEDATYVGIAKMTDYESNCIDATLHVVQSYKMLFRSFSQNKLETQSQTETLDQAALHLQRYNHFLQAATDLKKCTVQKPIYTAELLESAQLAKQMAIALLGWTWSKQDYVKSQAMYHIATAPACAAIGLVKTEYQNCAEVALLTNFAVDDVEHMLTCLK